MSNKVNIGNTPNDGTGDSLREFGQKFNNVIENPQFEKMPEIDGTPIVTGFKNVVINGDMRINQREFDGSSFSDGDYCWDRWQSTLSGMTQIIEEGNFVPSVAYTLSGVGLPVQIITSPSSGNWTLPEMPRTVKNVQLELGTTATPFEVRPIGLELMLCQRYYQIYPRQTYLYMYQKSGTKKQVSMPRTVTMRIAPTETYEINGAGVLDVSYSSAELFHMRLKSTDEDKSTWLRNIRCDAEL